MISLNPKDAELNQSSFIDRQFIMETFGISKSTLRRWVLDNGLTPYKINRRVFFKTEDFNKWIEQYRVG